MTRSSIISNILIASNLMVREQCGPYGFEVYHMRPHALHGEGCDNITDYKWAISVHHTVTINRSGDSWVMYMVVQQPPRCHTYLSCQERSY